MGWHSGERRSGRIQRSDGVVGRQPGLRALCQALLVSRQGLEGKGATGDPFSHPFKNSSQDPTSVRGLHIDKTSQTLESCLGRRRGVNVEMRKILKLNQYLVACSMVSKVPQKAEKVRTTLAKRV